MFRVVLQSRLGNIALAVVGGVYFVASIALLAYHATNSWGASDLRETLLNFVLAGVVIAGAWIVSNSAKNLGVRLHRANH